ncbi:MAG TPA: hypothetical protein VJ246_03790 [Patescibacteria group bacterium]|nr:hypothetical protein [Patescibacteria group bacterium]
MLTLLAQRVDIRSNLGSNVQFDLGVLVGRFAGVALLASAVATFTYMVYGGFQWIMAQGDKGKLDAARQMITQGLIGLGITASAFAIFRIINYFFGLGITIL